MYNDQGSIRHSPGDGSSQSPPSNSAADVNSLPHKADSDDRLGPCRHYRAGDGVDERPHHDESVVQGARS
jgi:hypothetical protein